MESEAETRIRRLVGAVQEAVAKETSREGAPAYTPNDVIGMYLTLVRATCVVVKDMGGNEQAIIDALHGVILDISTPKGQVS